MPAPFRVRDGDDPGRELGGWDENGNVDLPGTLTVDYIRGSGGSPATSTTRFLGEVAFDQPLVFTDMEAVTATFTGVVTVAGAEFLVLGTDKGYRFRPLGARLDTEATGSDWIFSVFSGPNFDGDQHTYLRLESGAALAHAVGTWIFTETADSAAVHTLDAAGAGALGFHGETPVARQTVTGSRGGNAALASLLTALDAMGLITDGTSA